MKIMPHSKPKRSNNIPYSSDVLVDQPSKKKALLIGINNTLMIGDGPRETQLKAPHKDVQAMRNLLVETYQYDSKNVVSLIDIDDPKQPQPTRDNILAEMKNLVADARRGDHFFFHYSGHVVQKENLDHTEEDGKDECLVPSDSDGENNLIMDDILRDILVDRLPQGCQLVAILDSCHSGSLLDLDHYRCNRVWVPWASKGRRKSDSLRNDVQRRNALVVIQNKRISDDRVKQCKTTLHPNPLAPLSFQRRTSKENSIPPTSPVASPTFTSAHKKLTRALTNLNTINALRPSPTRDSVGPKVAKTRLSKTIKSQFIPWLDIEKATSGIGGEEYQDELRRCESPVQDFCSGWCRSSVATPKSSQFPGAPEIISLASCKDSQEAWEVGEEHSMTQMLVEILKKDPNPTLKDLMVTVSHKLHNAAMSAHAQTKTYKKKMVRHRAKNPGKRKCTLGDTYGLNMNDFQDPQLSSTKPLDMGKRWNL